MKLKPSRSLLVIALLFMAFRLNAEVIQPYENTTTQPATAEQSVFEPLENDLIEWPIADYADDPGILRIDLRTVVVPGLCEPGDYTGCTLADVNSDTDPNDDFKPEIKVHFQTDDGTQSNAELRVRGNYSRLSEQKSYRVKLDSKEMLWRGEQKLQLNKHPWDITRVRNKLSFDLMQQIPYLPSLRTLFTQLYIDNEDYGLYTHIESVGKQYLQTRSWDKDSPIYKAKNFQFEMEPELALQKNGKPVDEQAFEEVLEIKRGEDHRPLIQMIQEINNPDMDLDEVFNSHFNLNNYLAWIAATVLTGNTDIFDSNFYLLNPNGSDDFYFIPWDYDDTWGFVTQPDNVAEGRIVPRWKFAPQRLMGGVLHQKFFRQPGAIDLLTEAVEQIKALYFTPQKIQALLDQYYGLTSPLTLSSPDIDHLPSYQERKRALIAEYNEVYQSLVDQLEVNYNRYMLLKEAPLPFFADTPQVKSGNLILGWGEAFDMQGNGVTYDIEVATSPEFKPAEIVLSKAGIVNTFYETPWTLPKGEYFAKIVARDDQDADNHWQYSFAEYEDPKTEKVYPGVVAFIAKVNGTPPPETGIFRDNFKNRSYDNNDGGLD